MSRFVKLLVALSLLAGFAAFAQDAAQPAPAPPAPNAKHHQMRGDQAAQRLKRLSKRLNLTDDQKEKIRPIVQDEVQQMRSVEDDTSMTPQQKHRKTREIRMNSKSQMDSILTTEQKEKLPSGRPVGEGRHRRHAGQANPTSSDPSSPQ